MHACNHAGRQAANTAQPYLAHTPARHAHHSITPSRDPAVQGVVCNTRLLKENRECDTAAWHGSHHQLPVGAQDTCSTAQHSTQYPNATHDPLQSAGLLLYTRIHRGYTPADAHSEGNRAKGKREAHTCKTTTQLRSREQYVTPLRLAAVHNTPAEPPAHKILTPHTHMASAWPISMHTTPVPSPTHELLPQAAPLAHTLVPPPHKTPQTVPFLSCLPSAGPQLTLALPASPRPPHGLATRPHHTPPKQPRATVAAMSHTHTHTPPHSDSGGDEVQPLGAVCCCLQSHG